MSYYQNSEEFYDCAQMLFDRVQIEYPDAADDVIKSKLIIGFRCDTPPARILINGRHNPASFSFGETKIRPEVEVMMKTDTLHRILMGELGLAKALRNKDVRVRGPAHKSLALANLFHQLQILYPQVLKDQGLYAQE